MHFNMIYVLYRLITFYQWILIIYALMSWVPNLQNSQVGRLLGQLARPFLSLFDRFPLQFAGLDFTIIVALLALDVIQRFLLIIF
ncbi:MAG: YggT family protein [Streptococcaceae bacterium]|jgi:YggT family protein|nr:YggT family protein [Streptococcaceae bacterium]